MPLFVMKFILINIRKKTEKAAVEMVHRKQAIDFNSLHEWKQKGNCKVSAEWLNVAICVALFASQLARRGEQIDNY